MLDPEKLANVRTILCHRNPEIPCADGVASALILRDALPDREVRFVTHDAELLRLAASPGMLFCDIVPPERRVAEFQDAGALVLDHHASAQPVVEAFGVDGVYADAETQPGISGAMLAFREVWMPRRGAFPDVYRERDEVEKLARLAGVRDTWQRSSPDWRAACEQGEALIFWPWDSWPKDFFTSHVATVMMDIGSTLLRKRETRTLEIMRQGMRLMTEKGTRAFIVPTRETSDVADALGDAADVVVGFGFTVPEGQHYPAIILSTRSHAGAGSCGTTFDCAAFSRANGGGGHARAAGCTIRIDNDDPNPYMLIADLLDAWEAHGTTGRSNRIVLAR